ncbi:MAG: hypothetical protein Tsb005_18800 [Gammaproteobacteria bacterium]
MNYQLIIQFPGENLDSLIKIEDALNEKLTDAEIDGHDIGSDEMNIFIFTDNPVSTFQSIKEILEHCNVDLNTIKCAYRDINSEEFNSLWPKGLKTFSVS